MRRGPLVAGAIIALAAVIVESVFLLGPYSSYVAPVRPADAPPPIANLSATVEGDPRFLAAENGSTYIFASYDYSNYLNGSAYSISLIYYHYGNRAGRACGTGPLTYEILDQLYANIPTASGTFNETAMTLEHFGPAVYNCPLFAFSVPLAIAIVFGLIAFLVELGFYLGRPRKRSASSDH
jgi:hypothetical protein